MDHLTKGRATTILTALLLVSVGINVALGFRLRQYTLAIEVQLAKLEASRLKAGVEVPKIKARLADSGSIETISFSDTNRSTVLYVLSPACGWCEKNENSIARLISQKRNEYRFIAISLAEDDVGEEKKKRDLGLPLYTGLSDETKKAYKMSGTPQTIVVSPKGVVIANWNGAYLGKQKKAVEDFFRIRLPEIDMKRKDAH